MNWLRLTPERTRAKRLADTQRDIDWHTLEAERLRHEAAVAAAKAMTHEAAIEQFSHVLSTLKNPKEQ